MKRIYIFLILILIASLCQAQSYYRLRYSWEEIDQSITAVRDTFPALIASKLDAIISHIELPPNPGAPTEIRQLTIKNPDFGKDYLPHRKNPAMVLVGLVGQIPLRKGQPTHPNWFFIRELDRDTDLWLVK